MENEDINREGLDYFSYMWTNLKDEITKSQCLCDKPLLSLPKYYTEPMLRIQLPEYNQSLEEKINEFFKKPDVIDEECKTCGKMVKTHILKTLVDPKPAIVSCY